VRRRQRRLHPGCRMPGGLLHTEAAGNLKPEGLRQKPPRWVSMRRDDTGVALSTS
jgi:hypothetical protein